MKSPIMDAIDRHTIDDAIAAVEHALRPYTVRRAELRKLTHVRDDLFLIISDARRPICDEWEDGPYEKLFDAWGFLTNACADHLIDTRDLESCLVALRQVAESA